MTTEEALKWYEDEISRLKAGPRINGCSMRPEWEEQIKIHTLAIAAIRAIQSLGKFGQLFLDYEGCSRGAAARTASPLEEEVLSMSRIKDVDGGEWIPVNADALAALANRYADLKSYQERENPKPLTLDELRQMDGKPVWMIYDEEAAKTTPGFKPLTLWALVEVEEESICLTSNLYGRTEYYCDGELEDDGITIYRQKLKEGLKC